MEQAPNTSTQNLSRKQVRATALLEFILVTILSGAIFYEYLHNAFLQSYVKNAIQSNAPILQFALPVGLAAIGGSIFIQRRKEARESRAAILREQILTNMRFGDAILSHAETIPHHQMIFQGPPDEQNLVFRKTNKKGRLSRNRDAERLPPEA
jgi:hypothetical protein